MQRRAIAAATAPIAPKDRLEAVIRRHALTSLDASNVKIRDIVIAEIPTGLNFNYYGLFNAPYSWWCHRSSAKDRKQYVIDVFDIIADIALKHHLYDNYDNPNAYFGPEKLYEKAKLLAINSDDPCQVTAAQNTLIMAKQIATIKPGCEHNVTRLITSEFFFYNAEEEGPYTEAEFSEIYVIIEEKAKQLPEGLHFVLATFPVANARNEVRNTALHVQCGLQPRVESSCKYTQASRDPYYPDHTLLNYNEQRQLCQIVLNIRNYVARLDEINEKYKDPANNRNDLATQFGKLIDEITTLCKNNQNDYPASDELMSELADATVAFAYNAVGYPNKPEKQTLLINNIKKLLQQYQDGHCRIALVDAPICKPITTYAPAGKQYATFIEVCLDHDHSVAVQTMKQCFDSKHIVPTHASHVLTSNSYPAVSKAIVTNADQVTHADPSYIGLYTAKSANDATLVKMQPVMNYTHTIFDQEVRIQQFPQTAVQPLKKEYLDAANLHNEQVIKATAAQMIAANAPIHPASEPLKKPKIDTVRLFGQFIAKDFIAQLQKQNIITATQAQNILAIPEFMRLINMNLLKPADFQFIQKHARKLLNEPEAHQHIFKLLMAMPAADFAKKSEKEKIRLLNLSSESYQAFIDKQAAIKGLTVR